MASKLLKNWFGSASALAQWAGAFAIIGGLEYSGAFNYLRYGSTEAPKSQPVKVAEFTHRERDAWNDRVRKQHAIVSPNDAARAAEFQAFEASVEERRRQRGEKASSGGVGATRDA